MGGVLLSHGEASLGVLINFNACMDCHEFFKMSSKLLGRKIQLRQPKMIHTFNDGSCSCKDGWRWEARFTPEHSVASTFSELEQGVQAAKLAPVAAAGEE